jgi:hypothetical protein
MIADNVLRRTLSAQRPETPVRLQTTLAKSVRVRVSGRREKAALIEGFFLGLTILSETCSCDSSNRHIPLSF